MRCITPLTFFPLLILSACSGGGSGDSSFAPGDGAAFEISSCSLGCTGSGDGLTCGLANIARNEQIAFEFTQPIDVASINGNSFRLEQTPQGVQPAGSFTVDPSSPRRLVFRPQLTFDSQGNPVFGLAEGGTYRLILPGTIQSSGLPSNSFLRSTSGELNRRRLDCTLIADQGVNDLRPGAPRVDVYFDVSTGIDPVTQESLGVEREVLANGGELLTNVYRQSEVLLVFNDVMNPATVVNPVTNEAIFIEVVIDPDGNPQDPSDQVPLVGSYVISIDQENIRTTVRFTPQEGLPSAGPNPAEPRLLVVKIPSSVVDLGGNSLANAGNVVGVPEALVFPEAILPGGAGEDFTTTDNRDDRRTGASWSAPALVAGPGGGSGRLGDLVVASGETVVLNTESQEFAPGGLIDNYDPLTGMPAAGEEGVTVDDGIFEFAYLSVEAGGVLRVEGANPPRLFARGLGEIGGRIDVSGASAGIQRSVPCIPLTPEIMDPKSVPELCMGPPCDPLIVDPMDPDFCEEGVWEAYLATFDGGAGAAGGPAGGDGGDGADVPDTTDPDLIAIGGFDNPNMSVVLDGEPGEGIPIPSTISPSGTAAAGAGGEQYPSIFPSAVDMLGNAPFTSTCLVGQVGAPGGGGGYGTPGGVARPRPFSGSGPLVTPIAAGGDPAALGITPLVRSLDPELGYLRGGAGGGGGGAHVVRTLGVGGLCIFGPPVALQEFWPASGAGGGGAGGAVQIQAGASLSVNGVVDAGGGSGGSLLQSSGAELTRINTATAGGGGSGGGVLLQGGQVAVAALPGRIDVSQGTGGVSVGPGARGGSGGAGLVRVESGFDAGGLPDFDALSERVAPSPDALEDYPQPAAITDVLSLSTWDVETDGPGVFSGAQSCWLRPEGNIFFVNYAEDDPGTGELGWDMRVVVQGVELSWRTKEPGFGGLSLEDIVGSDLGSSPIVVRFQAARAIRPISDLCDVQTTGLDSPLFPGSVSPWVRHPSELNDFFGTSSLRPNLIRFQIIFDRSDPLFPLLDGVTFLQIGSQPE